MARRVSCIAVALALSLVVCSSASAVEGALLFGFKTKGYTVEGEVQARFDEYLTLELSRKSGNSVQSHSYSIPIEFKPKKSHKRATVIGESDVGKIDMEFNWTKGQEKSKVKAPFGCKGFSGKGRKGKFTGKLVLKADTTFFKTIRREQIKGWVYKRNGSFDCSHPGAYLTDTFRLRSGSAMGFGPPSERFFGLIAEDAGEDFPDYLSVIVSGTVGRHQVSVLDKTKSLFSHGADALSADIHASGPFLSGSAHFAGNPQCKHYSDGQLKGDLTAKFDSYGDLKPFTGNGKRATLQDPVSSC